MTDIQPYLQRIVDRFANPNIQTVLKDFTRTILFKFTDSGEDWLIRAKEGKEATFAQETLENPDVTITLATDILAGVMDKKINGMAAYMQRKIQTRGSMEDLMKMQKLML
jgi:putative sterol carrier protein